MNFSQVTGKESRGNEVGVPKRADDMFKFKRKTPFIFSGKIDEVGQVRPVCLAEKGFKAAVIFQIQVEGLLFFTQDF